jgi:hypothetical protein
MAAKVRGVARVGSLWDFDTLLGCYRRMPKVERPRERPEWGDERAGECQDFVWHGLRDWWMCDGGRRMVIVPATWRVFWVPIVADVLDTRYDVWREFEEAHPGLYEEFADAVDQWLEL